MIRNPYTLAREIDREVTALAAGAAAGTVPAHEIAERLDALADNLRHLRRYLARRCDFDLNPLSEGNRNE